MNLMVVTVLVMMNIYVKMNSVCSVYKFFNKSYKMTQKFNKRFPKMFKLKLFNKCRKFTTVV